MGAQRIQEGRDHSCSFVVRGKKVELKARSASNGNHAQWYCKDKPREGETEIPGLRDSMCSKGGAWAG